MALTALLLPLAMAQVAADTAPPPEPDPAPPVLASPGAPDSPEDVDRGMIDGRRRPGTTAPLPDKVTQDNPGAVRAPPPEAFPTDQIPVPDRWRLIESLGVVKERWQDPYHQNTLKGDRAIDRAKVPWLPIREDDWFFSLSAVSDTVLEPRTFPIPVGVQTTERPGSLDVFGKDASFVFSQTFLLGLGLTKGNTAFKPPHIEYRVALAFNYNYVNVPERRVLHVEPSKPSHRADHFVGVQEAFIDYHLRNVSDRYDFDSVRVGVQPFQADFRGFLFNDQQLGIRFFGNRDDNRVQYNLAAFWRLEKDTNSGLNSVVQSPRDDLLFIANIYRQDFLIPSLTSQITIAYNRNREGNDIEIDKNGFPVRPALLGTLRGRDYDVVYLGYNADGHIGRLNLTASAYAALGQDRNSFFTDRRADIRAFFGAAELSYDHDWMRFRLSGLYASGDSDPYDDKETGFDAVFENPVFAGADTSYWIRQSIPFAGGGRVIGISGRNGVLNALRSSKEQGQSNFNNPGTMLAGAGADFDLTPQLRISANANHLWFENTTTLQTLRNEGSIPRNIGWDLSSAAIWRPNANQNIVLRLSGAALLPGAGFRDLFDNAGGHKRYYSVLANVILSY
ncbi:hypothetical protein [Novosphingobium colocasiae]|uniref:Alginate export domain-containing protein n=1 Tax=Novosphingobium colocasiae TaxID=1256513 RepID=A0A918UJ58_9SPHN|nr:hypothetical protein [Novosphingobium colocasiae]GGZ14043.1 hypothetical protein GCM10011614_31360 [Novosphingobium colocasiae]